MALASILNSLKLVLISIAVVFTVLGLKASLPFATTHLPQFWNLLLLCFKPPYLYIIVNAIIISILASSRFQFHQYSTPPPVPAYHIKSPLQFPQNDIVEPSTDTPPPLLEVKAVVVNGSPAMDEEEIKAIDYGINSIQESTWTELKSINSTEIPPEYLLPMEKSLISARFDHRKPLKSTPEGRRALREAKAKRHETLENTWKAITEGGGGCIQVKKHDAWGPLEVKKSATFKDRTHQAPVSKLRKEPSLSQDELNRRVEAFIRNFNQQMRLQKQESLNHYIYAHD